MKWIKKKLKKINIWDIQAMKFSCIFFGLFLAAWFPVYTVMYKWYFLLLSIIIGLKPMYKILKK